MSRIPEYIRSLGNDVKRAGGELVITQRQVEDAADVSVRTVPNKENYKGKPKLEVLYPLIRSLEIDSREVFYPELLWDSPGLRRTRLLVEECSEEEARALAPIIEAIIDAIRTNSAKGLPYKLGLVHFIENDTFGKLGVFFLGHEGFHHTAVWRMVLSFHRLPLLSDFDGHFL